MPISPQRLLIVDDYADNAEALALLLTGDAWEVEVAGTGAAAIARGLMWRPHLVVLDLGLSDVTGEEVAAALRAGGSTAYVVAYSGHHTRERAALAAGCDTFLLKPEVEGLLAIFDAVGHKATG